jgi:hypothetical protein
MPWSSPILLVQLFESITQTQKNFKMAKCWANVLKALDWIMHSFVDFSFI